MAAIFKREIGSYYNTMYGYVIGAVMLLFFGLFVWLINISGGYAELQYPFDYMCMVLILVVPVLTMRSFSEERRQKTDILLYSLPLRSGDVVMGKFLAAMTVLVMPTLLMMLYPLLLGAFGTINYAAFYSSALGFVVLMACLVSIGMFISSLTENQAVAAGISVAAFLFLYFLDALAGCVPSSASASLAAFILLSLLAGFIVWLLTRNGTFSAGVAIVLAAASIIAYAVSGEGFANVFTETMKKISPFTRFLPFIDGRFELDALVYLASVTAVFLVFTAQSVEKRRWS